MTAYLDQLAAVSENDFNKWTQPQQVAFLIDLYNAATLEMIIDHYPIKSIRKIGNLINGLWYQAVVQLLGKTTTLGTVEHKILRVKYTEPRIYAAGDVCMKWKFTHAADFAARIVIQNALFLGRKKLSALTMPWCTYTDPEMAHVGMYEREARERGIELDTYSRHFKDVDRAIADGEEEGFVKIHVRKRTDEILGTTIVARHAGEMISELSVAMAAKMGLGKLASVIHPYPTQAEAIRQCGDAYNRTRLTPAVKKLFGRWLAWTR